MTIKAQTLVSKENSIVWAMLRGKKGLTSIGKFRSIKKAESRCIEWANKFPNTRYIGVFRGYDEMKEAIRDHPLDK